MSPSKGIAAIFACLIAMSPVSFAQTPSQNINMVSGTSFPTGDPYLQRQNEPSIAASSRNPARLMAGANDYRSVNIPAPPGVTDETGDAWLGVFKSFNGGETWQSNLLPGYPQDVSPQGLSSPLHGFTTGADPVVRAGTSGMFYYSGIAFNRGTNTGAVFIARYVDLANKENGDPIQYLDATLIDQGTSGQFLDKPWLAVDIPRGSATCTIQTTQNGASVSQTIPAGTIYLSYSEFVGGSNNTHTQVLISQSTNCGQTWAKPSKVSASYQVNQGSTLAIDPQTGYVYIAWRQFSSSSSPNAILIAKSTDGGNTFSKVVTVQSLPDYNSSTPSAPAFFDQGLSTSTFRSNAYPSLAVDNNGELYLAWSQRGVNGTPDARIVVSTSPDGMSWSSPIPIDNAAVVDDANNSFTRGSQLMPSLTLSGGKLMALYYDLRMDHTTAQFTPFYPFVPDTNGDFYQQVRVPILSSSGLPDSPSQIFAPFISDAGLGIRHTLDVRMSQAIPSPTPVFNSTYVSRYNFGTLGDSQSSTDPALHQLQVNPPNLPMFEGGTVPFMGDYIEISGKTFLTPGETGSNWAFNSTSSGTPVGFATWTSNQDVRSPKNFDWTQSTNPDCPIAPTLDGSRNQNIYFSQITQGLSITVPQQTKPLSQTLQRAFVLELFNSTGNTHSFALTIQNQPAGGTASFAVAPSPLPTTLPPAVSTLQVTLPPHSGVTRSVFATSTNPTATIQVQASEIPNPGQTTAPVTSLSGFAVLNADPTVPTLVNPDASPGNISVLELYTPNLSNPNLSNPNLSNPNLSNPNLSNVNVSNPNLSNPNLSNPNLSNPNLSNVNVSNPNLSNPNLSNPNLSNTNLSNTPVSDVNYTVTNGGNTNSGYQVRLVQLVSALPGNPHIQLILSKSYATPVPNNCQLLQENTNIPIANITSPTVIDYTQIGANTSNNAGPENATMHLAPGETAFITIRGFVDLNTMQYISTVLIPVVRAEGAYSQDNVSKLAAPLTLVPATLQYALVGNSYTATIVAFGGTAPYIWSAPTGLPPGFSLNSSTGQITTSSATTPGTYQFTIQIQDASGNITTGTYSLLVVAPVQITTTTLPAGVVNAAYSTNVVVTGGLNPLTWAVSAGALPVGLTLNPQTGSIGGSATTAGSYNFTIRVTDSTQPTALYAQVSYSIIIAQPLSVSIPSLPDAIVGQSYSVTLAAQGGTAPFVWSVSSGTLPAGLTLSSSGTISGTPTTANTTGTQFTLKVQDSASPPQSASSNFLIPVGAPLQITPASLPAYSVGVPYSTTLQASGGIPPLTWSIASGSLPPGLSLASATGIISGTPTTSTVGTFTFTAKAADSTVPTAQTATHAYTIALPLIISTASLPDAIVGQSYSVTLAAQGGTAPYAWRVSSGALPSGLTLSSSGTISGIPTTVNTTGTQFTLSAQDSASPPQISSSNFLIRVGSVLQITTASTPNGQFNVAYTTTLQASGGIAPLTWSIASGSLPTGLSLASTTGIISGTPTAAGTFNFTAKVTDSGLPAQTATHTYTISVPNPLVVTFLVEPSNTSPKSQITPAIKVQVLDTKGNAVIGALVVLTIEVNPGGSVLSGTTSALTGNNGVAIFASNSLNNPGIGYELRATATYGTNETNYVISTPFSIE